MVALQPWQISEPPARVGPVRRLPNGQAEPRRLGSRPRSRSSPRRTRGTTDETTCLDRRGGRRCGVLGRRIGDRLEPMATERDHDGAARSPSRCARRAAQRARPGERRRDVRSGGRPRHRRTPLGAHHHHAIVTRPNAASTRRTVQPECPNRTGTTTTARAMERRKSGATELRRWRFVAQGGPARNGREPAQARRPRRAPCLTRCLSTLRR